MEKVYRTKVDLRVLGDEIKFVFFMSGNVNSRTPSEIINKRASFHFIYDTDYPVDVIVEIKNESNVSGIILDGFPRTINQATALENKIKQLNVSIKAVVNLDIADQEILNRLAGRGREDDKPELINNRLKVYRNQTEPLLQFYKERSLLDTINGDQSETDVSNAIFNVLKAEVI